MFHFVVGSFAAFLNTALWSIGITSDLNLAIAFCCGLVINEYRDGDFTKAQGGPWNGLCDWAAFLVPAVIVRIAQYYTLHV